MTNWYGTQAGIIGATALIVSDLKRLLGNVPYANAVPTWAYAVAVAGLLTVVSVVGLHAMTGDLVALLSQAMISAGASSGFYEWLNRPTVSLAASALRADVPIDAAHLPDRDVLTVGPRP